MNNLSFRRVVLAHLAAFTALPVFADRGLIPNPSPAAGYVELRYGTGKQTLKATGLKGGPVALEAHVFGPKGQGQGPATSAGDSLVALFEDAQLIAPAGDAGSMWWTSSAMDDMGVDPRGYYHLIVTLLFENRT